MFEAINEAVRGSVLSPLLEFTSTHTDSPIPTSQPTQNTSDFAPELDEIENQFTSFCSTAFNFETLQFRPAPVDISRPVEISHPADAILDALLPATRSTHQLIYRVNKLKHLALELYSLWDDYRLSASGGACPTDVAQFDYLLATVNLPLDELFTMAQACYNKQDERNRTNTD